MTDMIKNILVDALGRFAAEHSTDKKQSQFAIRMSADYNVEDDNGIKSKVEVPIYHYLVDWKLKEENVPFHKIRNKKFDFTQAGMFAKIFIENYFKTTADKFECAMSDISVYVFFHSKETEDVGLYLYVKNVPTQKIEFEELIATG